MDMSDSPHACKISMLWNWYTIDACFISPQWHIRTIGGYVGSVIGVFLVVLAVEGARRLAREYDRKILREHSQAQSVFLASASSVSVNKASNATTVVFRPTMGQQAIRSFFYFVQFSAGYILMLTAMYYNGGFLLAIFFGSFFGFFVSSWDTVGSVEVAKDCCC